MCAPMLGAVASIAGSVVGAMGAKSQADAQAAAKERQAQVKEINAIVAREDANANADIKEDEHEDAMASQFVAAAANGVIAGGGSFDDIQRESYKNKYMDISEISRQGEAEAIDKENNAKSDRAAAADIRKSGSINAAASILGGLASGAKGIATQIA